MNDGDTFLFDVFLSHSAKDKKIVRDIAERLKKDGIKVWFDEWVLQPGDSIPLKIEEGLEQSRVLVLCMSSNAFGSDWAQLESGTFRFRDPLNRKRRFVPVRLDDTLAKGSLGQFLYIDWRHGNRAEAYASLISACRQPSNCSSAQGEKYPASESIEHLARLVGAKQVEWKRLLADFEQEARKYHELTLSIFHIAKHGPQREDKFQQPNHAINLWQYVGKIDSTEAIYKMLTTEKRTNFGLTGAEMSVFGLIAGDQTALFCRMARRAGSLLPPAVNHIILAGVTEKFTSEMVPQDLPGKTIFCTNSDSLAKWINLVLIATTTSHPERLKSATLAVDPFTASLSVFDYFKLG